MTPHRTARAAAGRPPELGLPLVAGAVLAAALLIAAPAARAQVPGTTPEDALPHSDKDRISRELAGKQQELLRLTDSPEPVTVTYERATYDEVEGTSLFEGAVKIVKGTFSLQADRVLFRTATRDLEADGEVTVRFNEDELKARRAEYNILLERGTLYSVTGHFTPDVYFTADKVEKIANHPSSGQLQLVVFGGYFSSCRLPEADPTCSRAWSLTSGRALVHRDHYLHLRNALFWVKRAPLLYTPYWLVPIKPSRSTGLLVPDLGVTSRHGFFIRNAFYWAIADNLDLTLQHEWRSRTGDGEDLELRWALAPGSLGNVTASRRFTPSSSATSLAVDRESYRAQAQASHDFGYDLRATLDARYATDINFNRTYVDNFTEISMDSLRSTVGLEKSFAAQHFGIFYAQYLEDLRENPNKDRLIVLPRFRYRTSRLRLFGRSGFSTYLNLETDHVQSIAGEAFNSQPDPAAKRLDVAVERVAFSPTLSYRFQLPWLNFEPSFTLLTSWFSKRKFQDNRGDSFATYGEAPPIIEDGAALRRLRAVGDGAYRELFELALATDGPKFSRVFTLLESHPHVDAVQPPPDAAAGLGPAAAFTDSSPWRDDPFAAGPAAPYYLLRVKHVFFPTLHFSYVPEVGQDALIQISGSDVVRARSALTYGLTNWLFGKVYRGGDNTQVVQIADLQIRQTYDFFRKAELDEMLAENPSYAIRRSDRPLSDISADLDLLLGDHVRVQERLQWDPYEKALSHVSLGANLNHPIVDAGLYWGRSRNFEFPTADVDTLDLKLGWRVSPRFRWDAGTNYNITNDFVGWAALNTYAGFECWGFGAQTYYRQFRRSPVDTDFANDYAVSITITLKNVGSVGGFSLN
ncbi:MAG: LPS-assembly protein LptD [Candidatus Schekmanbacteria bacterium]|nr:LPS-assembly protein LptD [Candidatus Schekmanbacteria bacterium]